MPSGAIIKPEQETIAYRAEDIKDMLCYLKEFLPQFISYSNIRRK